MTRIMGYEIPKSGSKSKYQMKRLYHLNTSHTQLLTTVNMLDTLNQCCLFG